jgi:hypothetical protein
MARTHLTARKSTGHQPTGQLAPQNMPLPQEPHHESPPCASQEEEPFEIKLVVPSNLAAQGTPAEEQQEDHNINNEDEEDEEYSPLIDNEGEKLYRDVDERESFGAEAPLCTGRLRALLGQLGITSAPRYRIKGVPHLGRVEFNVLAEIFSRPRVLCRHKGLAFRAFISDAVVDVAWQAITSWSRCNKGELQNSVHHLLPQ